MTSKWLDGKDFIFLDPETPSQSSPERAFIYMILLNSPSLSSNKPFYIGFTANLDKRLSNHSAIKWHLNQFASPPKIWIAGSVRLEVATQAVEDLKKRLGKQDVLFYGNVLHHGHKRIEQFTQNEVQAYASSPLKAEGEIVQWGELWKLKYKYIRGNERGRYYGEGERAKEENLTLPNPNRADLMKALIKIKYDSANANLLSQKLGKTYDEKTGIATYTFHGADSKEKNERLVLEAQKISHLVKANWQLLDKDITTRTPISFQLTVNVKRMVVRENERNA